MTVGERIMKRRKSNEDSVAIMVASEEYFNVTYRPAMVVVAHCTSTKVFASLCKMCNLKMAQEKFTSGNSPKMKICPRQEFSNGKNLLEMKIRQRHHSVGQIAQERFRSNIIPETSVAK
jgi:hypothetical protein